MPPPKIAFFVRLRKNAPTLAGADLDAGNPGIGGTSYLFLLAVKELSRVFGNAHALLLTDTELDSNELGLPCTFAQDERSAIRHCETADIPNIVLNSNNVDRLPPDALRTSTNVFLWAHNTMTAKQQGIAAANPAVKGIVCVSQRQFENMRDTPCFSKCSFINNCITPTFFERAVLTNWAEELAVYVGSLVPQKGVHNLLDIWRHVELARPGARLCIIGGAQIWNADAPLGRMGIADPFYERLLQHRLGKLRHPENVRFLGALPWSRISPLIASARLGVVNPSRYMRDETFCLSAIELEAHGLPVVSRRRHDGLETSISHGVTGYLEKTDRRIASRIVDLLASPEQARDMGRAARTHASAFLAGKEIGKWETLVDSPPSEDSTHTSIFGARDSWWLRWDFLLKMLFLLESGKIFSLAKRHFFAK